MSAYASDPRVFETSPGHYDVACASGDELAGRVAPGLYGGFVSWVLHPDEVSGPGYHTADEAIRSLIGDPQ